MDSTSKFVLPSPNFNQAFAETVKPKPHYLTPSGMTLLPRHKQPPPMYGPRGATVPPKFYKQQQTKQQHVNFQKEQQPVERQYCEPCEMELQSQHDLQRHRAQHERCPVEDCNFYGHPTVMDKHITSLHASGLFQKVKNIQTPEEIAAWRAERRKKFPTAANVQLRQAAQEERMRRGERLNPKNERFGRREDRKRPFDRNGQQDNEKHHRGKKHNKFQNKQNSSARCNKQEQTCFKLVENKELTVTETKKKHEDAQPAANALQMLDMYQSDEEEQLEKPKDKTATESSSADEAPEEAPISRIEETVIVSKKPTIVEKQAKSVKKFQRKSGLNYSLLRRCKPNTMLEKLLEPEIRHERNVLLQCVRFVVDNKFFGIGQKSDIVENVIKEAVAKKTDVAQSTALETKLV